MIELTDKQALAIWNDYVENIRKQTALMQGETEAQQKNRIEKLEADPIAWCRYYFPQYCYADFADFQKEYILRICNFMEWYEVIMWSRELSKSTITMMVTLYLCLTKKKKYVMMISNSYDNAERLLMPYKGNLEANQRIIHDYGVQELPGKWEAGEFTTRKNFAFRALGAGQSPRGTRNEEARPDVIIFDDIDTDEECRNPDTIEKKWKWIEDAAISTRSISKETTIIFCGNKIANDCCVQRASQYADFVSTINIRDENGNSTWPQKNSEEDIDRILSQKSYASQQKEYFNNPIDEGQVFKEMTYGPCPPLKELKFVVVYADPSPSNRDRPGVKAKIQNSCKAVVIAGYHDNHYYIYKAFVDNTINAAFIEWLYAARSWIAGHTQPYFFIENNTLQNPFYEQVLLPLIYKKGSEPGQTILAITPDDRQKPDKYFRIEGNLEPLNRQGLLILNEKEKDNPHMRRLEAQFKSVSANSKTMDGPDAVEGAVFIIQNKIAAQAIGDIKPFKRRMTEKRY
jgi:hypothetical protein